jgi:hypothetical protein
LGTQFWRPSLNFGICCLPNTMLAWASITKFEIFFKAMVANVKMKNKKLKKSYVLSLMMVYEPILGT